MNSEDRKRQVNDMHISAALNRDTIIIHLLIHSTVCGAKDRVSASVLYWGHFFGLPEPGYSRLNL